MNINFEAVKAHYAGSDAKDIAAMMVPVTDTTEWRLTAGAPYAGDMVGAAAVIDRFEQIFRDWQQFDLKIEELIDGGDTIVATGVYNGVYRATGKTIAARVVHVWNMQDGKVLRFEEFTDTWLLHSAMTATMS